jgi:DNA-directed RNA polymerase II subunit RPB1
MRRTNTTRFNDSEPERVYTADSIQFSILGNNEILKSSVIVDNGSENRGILYAIGYENNVPKPKGVLDPNLGVSDPGLRCSYCGEEHLSCPGHPGHHTLSEPQHNLAYIPYLRQVMQCIDIPTTKLLIPFNDPRLNAIKSMPNNKRRFRELYNLITTNVRKSPYSNTKVPKIIKEVSKKDGGTIQIMIEYPFEEGLVGEVVVRGKVKFVRQVLSPSDCLNILSNLSSEEKELLGVLNPENMIIENFHIPPVAIRPTIRIGARSNITVEDSLTQKIADIVKIDNVLREQKTKEYMNAADSTTKANGSERYNKLLQYHIATYCDNESSTLPRSELKSSSNTATQSLSYRFKNGKEGRIRGNCMGKRVDFSARTVIGGDPNIGTDELGVPIAIAKVITYPEIVTADNIGELTALVRNGPDRYPGANNILTGRNRVIDLTFGFRRTIELELGWIVNRHLRDDDMVLLNRQPSLHKLSMMAHRAKIINDPSLLTFRLNVTATEPYNADFDGDEMNIFPPQSEAAKVELKMMASINRNMISPSTSTPIVTPKQDTILGTYRMTDKSVVLNRQRVQNLLTYTTIGEKLLSGEIVLEKREYSGQELLSMLMGEKINIQWKNSVGPVVIANGSLVTGTLTKSEIGGKKNNIIHQMMDSYGPIETRDFMDNVQRMTNAWFMNYSGFTIGLGDCMTNSELSSMVDSKIQEKIDSVNQLIREMESDPYRMSTKTFNDTVFSELSAVMGSLATAIIDKIGNENAIYAMLKSGSKGKEDNLGQIMACVGQQTFQGRNERFPMDLNGRTFPSFCSGDISPESGGFIRNSYLKGLAPHEFFFHHMSGRTGLIDTAIKTADTGYLQRKFMKMLEDSVVSYTSTVVNSLNHVIQFVYGETGYDSAKQIEFQLEIVNMDDAEIDERFTLTKSELKAAKWTPAENVAYNAELKAIRDMIRENQFKATQRTDILTDKYNLPFNIRRVIDHRYNVHRAATSAAGKVEQRGLTAADCLAAIERILHPSNTYVIPHPSSGDDAIVKTLLRSALMENFAPKQLIGKYNLSKEDLDAIVVDVIQTHNRNLINPGDMVGSLAAQSICEPLTQMTLNTFHATGLGSSVGGMMGIPRVKEIISFTANIKKPTMVVCIKEPYNRDESVVRGLASRLPLTNLESLSSSIEIIYDKHPSKPTSYHKRDRIGASILYATNAANGASPTLESYPWLIRVVLNEAALSKSTMTLPAIRAAILRAWMALLAEPKHKTKDKPLLADVGKHLCVGSSDSVALADSVALTDSVASANAAVVHIRFASTKYSHRHLIQLMELLTSRLTLCGIDGITATDVKHVNDMRVVKKPANKEYQINMAGCSLTNILHFKIVDPIRTVSDNLYMVYCMYGIEAVRNCIISQFISVFENAGKSLNIQHLSLLVDSMTSQGVVTSVSRYGLNKLDTDPLSRASFEKTVEMLVEAAVFSEKDTLTAVSSRIMSGKTILGGTGYMDILMNTEQLINTDSSSMPTRADSENKPNLFESNELIDGMFAGLT